jgi:hypothetical protein
MDRLEGVHIDGGTGSRLIFKKQMPKCGSGYNLGDLCPEYSGFGNAAEFLNKLWVCSN